VCLTFSAKKEKKKSFSPRVRREGGGRERTERGRGEKKRGGALFPLPSRHWRTEKKGKNLLPSFFFLDAGSKKPPSLSLPSSARK